MTRCAAALAVAMVNLGPAFAAEPCPETKVLYIPVQSATEQFGLRGETREQYLDRTYGAGKWEPDVDSVIRIVLPPNAGKEPIRVVFSADGNDAVERADVIVETRLDYIDELNRRTLLYGHRLLGSYKISPGASTEITVPLSAFNEPGALLIAAVSDRLIGSRVAGTLVHALPVGAASCEQRVYVHDRFTAIRLNRARK